MNKTTVMVFQIKSRSQGNRYRFTLGIATLDHSTSYTYLEMQTERAKRMDSAGEEASLNSPELPWNQLYWKRRTESRIQLRRRVCFTGPAAAAFTVVLAILILAAGSVSSDSEFVKVPSSVKCTEGQDCILSCTFYYTAGGWDEKSAVIWRRAETDHIVHGYYNNRDQLNNQSPQYVNRTSLFDSELQRGNASLLLRRVREEDAGEYKCSVNAPRLYGSGLTEVVVVPAQPTTAPAPVTVPSSVKCSERQDCILSCTFNYTAGGWDEKSGVIWRRAETGRIVHGYHDNTDQLADQLPQYVNRTSLFDSELQHGNVSLLLRRVREEDAGEYRCFVSTPRLSGSALTEVVVVPAQRHAWWVSGAVLFCVIAGLCVGLWLYKRRAGHR
ncbi:CD276 antigen-like [Acipenser ruthenus]|uniref:CD276 antigen-like n=1 Tax=Acipenser ruthenus TaxID=7906 RepID=UPI002741603C|nr:CD276 antigen-like [Acipenser ruthenus]